MCFMLGLSLKGGDNFMKCSKRCMIQHIIMNTDTLK